MMSARSDHMHATPCCAGIATLIAASLQLRYRPPGVIVQAVLPIVYPESRPVVKPSRAQPRLHAASQVPIHTAGIQTVISDTPRFAHA